MVLWYSRLNIVAIMHGFFVLKQQDRKGDLGVRCSECVERVGMYLTLPW